ncbi:GNAT family protein [Falsibacillus albus]|uniref:GNAT family N-acetyltransferase n=1 Tax=Falsibacillus albus TaxID=2478915 RepID=A0A3L7JXX9_9BACI|nr:GNAT family N-acetyltransferase [Falsibacillus albus]RLQ95380.1 GNAT family N-acetyltransferase [Falsibacillus albus]
MSIFAEALVDQQEKSKSELKEEIDQLEIQMFRMQQSMKEIAKKWDVLGIDQTKEDNWVIVYAQNDGNQCKVMVNDCETRFDGVWDFSIHATFSEEETIHIGDIKGPANKGYGSICMKHLKEIARDQNIPVITGDIAKRDWDHVDRLIHFYEKHDFEVEIDNSSQSGEIVWKDY